MVRGQEINSSFELRNLISFLSGGFLLAFLLSAKQGSKSIRTVRKSRHKHHPKVPMKQTIIWRPHDIDFVKKRKDK